MRLQSTVKGYDVFKNGMFLGFVQGQSREVRVRVARLLIQSTHMGQWRRDGDTRFYETTIGIYLRFEPVKRIADMVSNYRITDIEQ